MPDSKTKKEEDLDVLKSTVSTALDLIAQLKTTPPTDSETNNINAIDLAHDAASLVRAHTTKLSLLIINKPFTPPAITKILRELVAGPLPGLASAVELCSAGKYTKAMGSELQYWAGRVFQGVRTLVEAIPLDGNVLSDDAKRGTGAEKGNGSLAITGTIWEACDAVVGLKKLGVAGLVIKKAQEYTALLQDALEELQEWGEETSDDEDEFEGDDEVDETQAAVDNLLSQRHIPEDDPDKIRPRLETSLKRLKLLTLMYQAVVKRRFKTLPQLPRTDSPTESVSKSGAGSDIVSRVDEVLDVMEKIPGMVDELASSFYELDGPEIDKKMDSCSLTGFAVTELLTDDWNGKKDEFTDWATKFQAAIKKG